VSGGEGEMWRDDGTNVMNDMCDSAIADAGGSASSRPPGHPRGSNRRSNSLLLETVNVAFILVQVCLNEHTLHSSDDIQSPIRSGRENAHGPCSFCWSAPVPPRVGSSHLSASDLAALHSRRRPTHNMPAAAFFYGTLLHPRILTRSVRPPTARDRQTNGAGEA
jgi:hypothetical protein